MHWVDIVTSGGSATVLSTGVGAVVARVLKRIAKDVVSEAVAGVAKESDLRAIHADVAALQVKIAAETGGNSNGLRQAVNALSDQVAGVKVDVAHVKGYMEAKRDDDTAPR